MLFHSPLVVVSAAVVFQEEVGPLFAVARQAVGDHRPSVLQHLDKRIYIVRFVQTAMLCFFYIILFEKNNN